MRSYCTLFDSAYLLKGLALYESLARFSASFHLYVICFDDECYRVLKKLSRPSMTPICLSDFESGALLEVKKKPFTDRVFLDLQFFFCQLLP